MIDEGIEEGKMPLSGKFDDFATTPPPQWTSRMKKKMESALKA